MNFVAYNMFNICRLTVLSDWFILLTIIQALVVQKVDNTIHWINLYPGDSAFGLLHAYPSDSDLSSG